MRFSRTAEPKMGNCFVIMPFGKKKLSDGTEVDWDDFWLTFIKPAIEGVGMSAIRADDIYGAQPLMERVWTGIQEAEIVITELTGRSPNVLYELGLAHVIGKSFILLTREKDDVPADLAQFVQVRYSYDPKGIIAFNTELRRNLEAIRRVPAQEMRLVPLRTSSIEAVSAQVLTVAPEFAAVQSKDGRRAFLNREDYSWTWRGNDLTKVPQLEVGQELAGAFVSDDNGQTKYSLIAIVENPWTKLLVDFPIDKPFKGRVINFAPFGAFVQVRGDINGLIPKQTIPAGMNLQRGDEVEVKPFKIDVAKREVELRFITKTSMDWDKYPKGQIIEGTVLRVIRERGFALVKLRDNDAGLLPLALMSAALKNKWENGEITIGFTLSVEVVRSDESQKRVELRDAEAS